MGKFIKTERCPFCKKRGLEPIKITENGAVADLHYQGQPWNKALFCPFCEQGKNASIPAFVPILVATA